MEFAEFGWPCILLVGAGHSASRGRLASARDPGWATESDVTNAVATSWDHFGAISCEIWVPATNVMSCATDFWTLHWALHSTPHCTPRSTNFGCWNDPRSKLFFKQVIEGRLEVKLPTIWADEKQGRAEAERRERLEERRVEEKESEERRCRYAKR